MSAAEPSWVAAKECARPGHIRARDASELTGLVGAANSIRSSSLRVLELLLRFGHGRWPVKKTMSWIAGESMISTRMARYAIGDLVERGLVDLVVEGGGRRFSQYQVNVEGLRARVADPDPNDDGEMEAVARLDQLLLDQVAEPAESADSQDVTPATIAPHPGNHCPPPRQPLPGSSDDAPCSPPSLLTPLPPATASASQAGPSPAASRGDPLRWQSQPEAKCVHGRTRAQGGCRTCRTTSRDDGETAKRAQAATEAQRAIRRLAEQRAAEAQTRAVSVPPPADWRHR